jgi:hypothetical protein
MKAYEDDGGIIEAAMEQLERWRSSKQSVYVAIRHGEEWADLEGTIAAIDRFVRFQDALAVYKIDFLPHMFVHVSVESSDEGTTIKCEQSPYGVNIEISDIQRRLSFAEVEASNPSVQ